MSPLRRLGLALFTTALGLTLLEGGSAGIERGLLPRVRHLPLPFPGTLTPSYAQRFEAERRDHPATAALRPDPVLGWMPAFGETSAGPGEGPNRFGLRGEDPPERTPGDQRVLSIGDSSVYGTGVPSGQVFVHVAATALSRAWERPVVGVNGGVSGQDARQSRMLLMTLGPEIDPDWVIIANLWSDIYRREPTQPQKAFFEHFALYRVTRWFLSPWLRPRTIGWIVSRADIGAGEGTRNPIEGYIADLRDMAQWCRVNDAHPVFLVLPAPLDFDTTPPPATVLDYREAMRQVASSYQAPLVDAPAYFKAHDGTVSMFLDQVHPNEAGHYLIGKAIAEALAPVSP